MSALRASYILAFVSFARTRSVQSRLSGAIFVEQSHPNVREPQSGDIVSIADLFRPEIKMSPLRGFNGWGGSSGYKDFAPTGLIHIPVVLAKFHPDSPASSRVSGGIFVEQSRPRRTRATEMSPLRGFHPALFHFAIIISPLRGSINSSPPQSLSPPPSIHTTHTPLHRFFGRCLHRASPNDSSPLQFWR